MASPERIIREKYEKAQLGVFGLSSKPTQFTSASAVGRTFGLAAQPQPRSRKPVPTIWDGRYPDDRAFTWGEPALAQSRAPVCTHIKEWINDPNSRPSTADQTKAWKTDFKADMEWRHKASQAQTEARCDIVFRTWKSGHALNRYHSDLPYATTPGLQDWEMKCALEGDWKGISHMLKEEQELVEPENLKPDPDFKLEWKLAVKVYRLKQAHDTARAMANTEFKTDGEHDSYAELVNHHLGEAEKEAKNRCNQKKTTHAVKSKVAPSLKTPKLQKKSPSKETNGKCLKQKRDETEDLSLPALKVLQISRGCWMAADPEVRRSTRERKPRVHSDTLDPVPLPPTTNGQPTSFRPYRLVLRLPPPPPSRLVTLRLPPAVLARFPS